MLRMRSSNDPHFSCARQFGRKNCRAVLFVFAVFCCASLPLALLAQWPRISPRTTLRSPQTAKAPAPGLFTAIIDLTQTLSEKSPNWEGAEKSPFEAHELGNLQRDGYFSRHISLPEHFSTHMDAPAHFAAGRWTVDQIPPERLVAPLVVLDVRPKARLNRDYQVTVEDVMHWEQINDEIPSGAIVMANTGWAAKWKSMEEYRGADEKGVMHFPGFSMEAAKLLVEGRGIVGLGIDTLSIDYGASKTYPVHQYTLTRNVYQLENVGDLSRAPEAGAIVVAAPAKLEGGSGGPVRILALVK